MRGRIAWLLARPETQTYRAATDTLDQPYWGVAEYLLAEITNRVGAMVAVQVKMGGGDMDIPDPVQLPGYTVEQSLPPAASMDDIVNFFGVIKDSRSGQWAS